MARSRKTTDKPTADKRPIEQYDHKGQQRKNNPPVGLVTEATDRDAPTKQYAYDPHLDPTLTGAGKAEHTGHSLVPHLPARPSPPRPRAVARERLLFRANLG
jgi:hypothetical protein